jgi:hypothetical protein
MMQAATSWRAAGRRCGAGVFLAMLCAMALVPLASGAGAAPIAVAVADFDYFDTSGEVVDQSAEHRARVASFAALLRDNIAAERDYRVVRIECPDQPCTASSMSQDLFIAAARKAGARLVIYGGIRKMSTLVQWGEIQLLDLEAEKLLMRRTVTFRGDNDAAYRHAANFVSDTLKEIMPKP